MRTPKHCLKYHSTLNFHHQIINIVIGVAVVVVVVVVIIIIIITIIIIIIHKPFLVPPDLQ